MQQQQQQQLIISADAASEQLFSLDHSLTVHRLLYGLRSLVGLDVAVVKSVRRADVGVVESWLLLRHHRHVGDVR